MIGTGAQTGRRREKWELGVLLNKVGVVLRAEFPFTLVVSNWQAVSSTFGMGERSRPQAGVS